MGAEECREPVELIPVGLLLIAQDVPPLREPVAEMTLWLERQWVRLRGRRQQRRRPDPNA